MNETLLEQIAADHRVPCKRRGPTADDELIVPGKWGHLWEDAGRLMICFTDDGAKRPLTKRKKTKAIAMLGEALVRITQNAEAEFSGEILQDHASVERAIRILGVKRFRADKDESRAFGGKRAA